MRIRIDRTFEGEGDFIVAIPDRGILVIEVKSGAIEIHDGFWLQNGRKMDKAPRDQAHRYKNGLMARLEPLCKRRRPWVAVACAFPDTPFSSEPTEGSVAGAVLGQQDLPYLNEALIALAERLFNEADRPRDGQWIDALHSLWCETWTPKLSMGERTQLREQELIALDAEQLKVLDYVDESPRMLVRGGAGTGKTLIAREMCRRLAARGQQPLYLCFTNALAAGLRTSWGKHCGVEHCGVEHCGVEHCWVEHCWTVRQYAADLLERAGIAMQNGAPQSSWSAETWELAPLQAATDALPGVEIPHDAVVVDEGQDMSSTDWDLVQAIAQKGPLWVFADERQGFWESRAVPEGVLPAFCRLTMRYRCPEPLARFADRYALQPEGAPAATGADADGGPSLPIDELRVVKVPTQSAVPNKVALEIQKALGAGMKPRDIAVLTLAGQSRTTLGVADKIGQWPVVRADDPEARDHVVADTFLRFKGLERPWIIVTEVYLGERRYDVRMHVALTRATVGCVVVATAEQIEKDVRLQVRAAE